MDDIRRLMPLLERRRAESGHDDQTATRLVEEVVCRPWSDYWVGFALDWIDTGIWSDKIAGGLRAITQDKQFSQATRHRAWRYARTESEATGRCSSRRPAARRRST